MKIWTCKIWECERGDLRSGADLPMRKVVEAGYLALTGKRPDFIFSGWGGELDEIEREIVNKSYLPKKVL